MLGNQMHPYFVEYLRLIAAERRIDIDDVRAIRTVLDEEIAIDREIAGQLIDLDHQALGPDEWSDFLADTVADFVVWGEGSHGKVLTEMSEWLIAALRGSDGIMAPSAGRILEAVMRLAEEPPAKLGYFAHSFAELSKLRHGAAA